MKILTFSLLLLLAVGGAQAQLSPEAQVRVLDAQIINAIQAGDRAAAAELFAEREKAAVAVPPPLQIEMARVYYALGDYAATHKLLTDYLNTAAPDSPNYDTAVAMYAELEAHPQYIAQKAAEAKRQAELQAAAEAKRQAKLAEMERRKAEQAAAERKAAAKREAERKAAAEAERKAAAAVARLTPKCNTLSEENGSACWLKVSNQSNCYAWHPHWHSVDIEWSGACKNGMADGNGKETWPDGFTGNGRYVDGKAQGHWVERTADGNVFEGEYVDGKRHGKWVLRDSDGVSEGPYVNGKRHGKWVLRDSYGVSEGPYVNGKRHGKWVLRDSDGVSEGPYVNGKRHGKWVERWSDGNVDKRCYKNGEYRSWTSMFNVCL